MCKAAVFTFVLVAASFTAFTQSPGGQELFTLIRGKVRSDLQRAPRYTCVQTVTRIQYHPPYTNNPKGCPAFIAARAALALPGRVVWRDRLRFDVAVGEAGEMFSWAGATEFDSPDLGALALSGSTGSGDFASFLSAVFGPDAEQFRYLGNHDTPLGFLATFSYKVPQLKSHYNYRSEGNPGRIIGYEGSFYADPKTGDLKRLIVETDEFVPGDSFCHVRDTMDYGRVKIGEGEFLLPNTAKMVILFTSGDESYNEKRYSGCKEFTGTSKIRFEDDEESEQSVAAKAKAALKAVPANTHIKVRLDPPIDSEVAAAGDPVIGLVDHEVKQKGQVVIRATDRLHGRILRFEQFFSPEPHWLVAIRFDTIERDGIELPASFAPLDDGDRRFVARTPGRRLSIQATVVDMFDRPKGGGVFLFPNSNKLVLGKNFESEWATR